MINTKHMLLTGAAILSLGIVSASAADMSATTDATTSNRTVGAGADATSTVAPEAGADAKTTTTVKTKKTMHKKHAMHKKPIKKSEVLNATPGDVKTSNDDSGMSGDVQAHDKAAVSTTDKSSDNQ